jgi:hypothetical protein
MEAVAALNTALKQPLRRPATAQQRSRRATLAALAARAGSSVMGSMLLLPVRLTLPEATLAALTAGVALSLEAGAATAAELWACAQQTGDRQMKHVASFAAERHICIVGQCVLSSKRLNAPQGWSQVAAPLLAPPALLALL